MRIRKCFIVILLGSLAMSTQGAEPEIRQLSGLTVRDGQLLLKGKPFQGIGANYFSLFSQTLKNPSDKSYRKELKQLSNSGIPFVRFMGCGFWPSDWDMYLNAKDAYFQLLDEIVRCAEENDIGLIPSLFWNMATVPDIVAEPMDQFGNPDSKTIAFIRQYTKEIVLRYNSSEAIWGWEFGNEYNLHVDLPNASTHRPPVWPKLKTALKRTQRDELSSQAMLLAFAEFAKTVRQYDKHRILLTGNSIPRSSAYHNSYENNWQRDSLQQFEEVLQRDNPNPFDLLSVHVYPKETQYPADATNLTDLIKTMQEIAIKTKKPLFVGEFGAPRTLGANEERSKFLELVSAIETNKIPLSAFWVYDFAMQNNDWNITFENERHFMLKLVAESNSRMQATQRDE